MCIVSCTGGIKEIKDLLANYPGAAWIRCLLHIYFIYVCKHRLEELMLNFHLFSFVVVMLVNDKMI